MDELKKLEIKATLLYFGVFHKDITPLCNIIERIIDET